MWLHGKKEKKAWLISSYAPHLPPRWARRPRRSTWPTWSATRRGPTANATRARRKRSRASPPGKSMANSSREWCVCVCVYVYVCVLHRVCVCVCCIVCPSAACAKRPICMPKETYLYVKIDLPFAASRARVISISLSISLSWSISSSLFSLPARSDRLCGTWFFFCRGEKSSSPRTWPSWPCSTSKQASCRFHYSPAGGPSRPHGSLEYPIPKPLCSPPSVASADQSPAFIKPPPNSPS